MISARSRNRSVESDLITAPSAAKTNVVRNETNGRRTSVSSTQLSTRPTPGMSTHLKVCCARPAPPRFLGRVSSLENKPSARLERSANGCQHGQPLPVGHKDLSDVARHGDHVDLERGQRRCLTNEPSDRIGAGLPARHLDRGRGRVHRYHHLASLGQQAGEGAGTAANIQDGTSAELIHHRRVDVEIGAVGIQPVIDLSQPWLGEVSIHHQASLSDRRARRRRVATSGDIYAGRGRFVSPPHTKLPHSVKTSPRRASQSRPRGPAASPATERTLRHQFGSAWDIREPWPENDGRRHLRAKFPDVPPVAAESATPPARRPPGTG